MPDVTFYRQARVDGGIRTGIEVNGETVFGRFENRGEESDPVLSWYVDVRCRGRRLPARPEEARRWLLALEGVVEALRALADEARAGIDFNTWPLRRAVPGVPKGVKVEIACYATRRADGRAMPTLLADLADRWRDLVAGLPALEPAPRSLASGATSWTPAS